MVLSMERWKGKVAIVTGASSGIGEAIAEHLADAGLKVVALARRKEKLEQLQARCKDKGGELYFFPTDVSKEEDILNAFKWIKETIGSVHVLVNCAGIIRRASLVDGQTQCWIDTVTTNVIGLCVATREAILEMRANKIDGHIIHMNSIYGHKIGNVPQMNIYPATKYSITALTECLRKELKDIQSKIKVTSISPGLVKTEISDSAIAAGITDKNLIQMAKFFMKTAPTLKPSDVAETVLYVLSTPPNVQVHELIVKPVGEID